MFIKFLKKIRYKVLVLILNLKHFKLNNAIVICSDPRGGSTWLMELFNKLPTTIINSEPLQVNAGVVPKGFNFGWNPYFPKEFKNEKLECFFYKILTFKIFNRWTTSFVSLKKIIWARKVVTKFVLANQLLPWLVVVIGDKLKHKPVYLVRHPIPTCMSQLKTFHKVSGDRLFLPLSKAERFNIPNDKCNELYKEHQIYINSLNSKLERHIALWCINNADLLRQESSGEWQTLFYEDLIENPKNVFINLLNSIHVEYDIQVINKINFRKPSHSNFNKDFKLNVDEQLNSYLGKFTKDELNKLQAIFDYFKIVHYSAFNAYPIKIERQAV